METPWRRSATRATPRRTRSARRSATSWAAARRGPTFASGSPPRHYGWPQDAIDAVLFVLFNAGILQARSGSEVIPKGKLDQKNIPTIEFRVESVTLTKVQLIELRTLFKAIGLNTQPNYESVDASKFLERLTKLAEDAGGEAPLPKRPGTSHLDDLANRVGNDQLKAIHDLKDS